MYFLMFHAIFLIKIHYALVTCYITVKYIYILFKKASKKQNKNIKFF